MEKIENTYLTVLRDKDTELQEFRKASDQIAGLLAHRAAAMLPMKEVTVETPLANAPGLRFDENIILIPILRSGLALLPQFLGYFHRARVGVVGIQRDEETAEPHFYYDNIPKINEDDWIIVLDPMIATGGTATAAIQALIKHGCNENRMLFASVVSAPEGLEAVNQHFPGVRVITSSKDLGLNNDKFIVPGLGDFGDRYFGTI